MKNTMRYRLFLSSRAKRGDLDGRVASPALSVAEGLLAMTLLMMLFIILVVSHCGGGGTGTDSDSSSSSSGSGSDGSGSGTTEEENGEEGGSTQSAQSLAFKKGIQLDLKLDTPQDAVISKQDPYFSMGVALYDLSAQAQAEANRSLEMKKEHYQTLAKEDKITDAQAAFEIYQIEQIETTTPAETSFSKQAASWEEEFQLFAVNESGQELRLFWQGCVVPESTELVVGSRSLYYLIFCIPKESIQALAPGSWGLEVRFQNLLSARYPVEIIEAASTATAERKALIVGRCMFYRKEYSVGLEEVKKGLEENPQSAMLYVLQGDLYDAMDRLQEALTAYETAYTLASQENPIDAPLVLMEKIGTLRIALGIKP